MILPALSILYMLGRRVTRVTGGIWTCTESRPVARAALAPVGLALVAGLAWLWWPNGEYEPLRRGERWTVQEAVADVRKVPTGRPGYTVERKDELDAAADDAADEVSTAPDAAPTTTTTAPGEDGTTTTEADTTTTTPADTTTTTEADAPVTTAPSPEPTTGGDPTMTQPQRRSSRRWLLACLATIVVVAGPAGAAAAQDTEGKRGRRQPRDRSTRMMGRRCSDSPCRSAHVADGVVDQTNTASARGELRGLPHGGRCLPGHPRHRGGRCGRAGEPCGGRQHPVRRVLHLRDRDADRDRCARGGTACSGGQTSPARPAEADARAREEPGRTDRCRAGRGRAGGRGGARVDLRGGARHAGTSPRQRRPRR